MNNRIKELRTKEELTLEYVSYVSCVSISYLSKLEHGYKKNPSIEVMNSISKVFNLPIEEVFFSH